MERDEIVRWGVVFAFAFAFFVTLYMTIIPDARILALPTVGMLFVMPLVYVLERFYKVSAFEPIEYRAPKKHIYVVLGLAVATFLIFDFVYIAIPGFSFSANFYVGLVLFVFAYVGIALGGGPALRFCRDIKKELFIALILTLAVGAFSVVSSFLGVVIAPYRPATITIPTALFVAFFLMWALLAAVVEELAFRGVLAPLLASRTGIAVSATVVSLTFMVYHYLAYGADPLALSYLFVLSMLLTVVALYTGSILPALIAHVLNNLLASLAYVSPLLGLMVYATMLGAGAIPVRKRLGSIWA